MQNDRDLDQKDRKEAGKISISKFPWGRMVSGADARWKKGDLKKREKRIEVATRRKPKSAKEGCNIIV